MLELRISPSHPPMNMFSEKPTTRALLVRFLLTFLGCLVYGLALRDLHLDPLCHLALPLH